VGVVTMGVQPLPLAVRLQRSTAAALSVVKKDETGAQTPWTAASLVVDKGATFTGAMAGSTATFTLSGADVDALWALGHPYSSGTTKPVRVRLMDGATILAAGVVEWSDGFTPGSTSQTSSLSVSSLVVPAWSKVTAWASGVTYRPDAPTSVVTYQGETYICSAPAAFVSGATFDPSKWTRLAAQGSQGVSGIVVVSHGASTSVARPTAPVVYWVGTARPANALPYDLWYNA
jgi:hypothetical protein